MPYCTKEQVSDEFNGSITFGTSTNPTDTTVDRWIAEADALIDSKVGLRYLVPVTNATDLLIIRSIAVMLVAARVRKRLNRASSDGETAKKVVSDGWNEAQKMLDQIAKGTMELANTDLRSTTVGTKSFTSSCADPHTFKKNCDQW